MVRFRYRLQAALAALTDRERRAKVSHAQATGALECELHSLGALDSRKTATERNLRARGSATASEFHSFDAYLVALERARQTQLGKIAGARRRLAESRAALEAATLRKRALERHRERALTEFERLQALAEAAELDETNARAFVS
ncbi:MAG: flagellar export protein FliJ [Vulcanimicrobiaceae bacterium]